MNRSKSVSVRFTAPFVFALAAGSIVAARAQDTTPATDPPAAPPLDASTAPSPADVEASDPARTATPVTDRVRLEFRDQEWLPALVWLAEQLRLNLDYQELPEGTFSLVSTRTYTVEEAEDLLNMQLLARGFTLLKRGEVLRLSRLDGLDVTLVPRVEEAELASLPKHRLVRTSLTLEWMLAEEAAEEFKPLLSPHGKLYPMASSNRLDALDVVINLREIHSLLRRAEADKGRREQVEEFPLKHRRAVDVAAKIRRLLGLPPEESDTADRNVSLDIAQAAFKAEALRQLGRDARDLITDQREKQPTVRLIVNKDENSILVHARPDKLELVRQAVKAMDTPKPEAESAWETLSRVKMYPVDGFDPTTISRLLSNLQERGNLSPDTKIQYEPTYNRIVAIATPSDQLTISQLIDGFRLAGRQAYVLALSEIDPAYAVRAIELVLFDSARKAAAPNLPNEGQFRVEADLEHRRLLLWASPEELQEVRQFLAQLGEADSMFKSAGPSQQIHRLNLRGRSLAEVTGQLRGIWSGLSRSSLEVLPRTSASPDPQPESAALGPAPAIAANRSEFFVASQRSPAASPAASSPDDPATSPSNAAAPTDAPPPADDGVRIVEGADGEVMVVSADPANAGLAKQLLEELLPKQEDVRVIEIQHAQASSVKRQLDAVLQHTATAANDKLTVAKPLLINVDSRTNRLLIQHASEKQMRIIQQMLPILDKPEREDARLSREQRTVRIRFRRANDVASVVKEVYRDLLSVTDSTFAEANKGQLLGYNQAYAASAKNPEYQGLLAVGIDKESNSLVISAPRYLMPEVVKLIESVDTPADGDAVAVVPFRGDSKDPAFTEALRRILREREDRPK